TNDDGTQFVQQSDNIIEETLIDIVSLSRGESKHHSFDIYSSFRIIFRVREGIDSVWKVSEFPKILNWVESACRPLLASDGIDAVLGNGIRSMAYTDVITPLTTSNRLLVEHDSNSPNTSMSYEIVLQRHLNSVESSDEDKPTKTDKSLSFFEISESGEVEPRNNKLIYESEKQSTLEFLEFSTNHFESQVILQYKKNGDNHSLGLIKKDGTSRLGIHAKNIIDEGSSMWRVTSYQGGAYKFSLRNPIHFPEGFRVLVRVNASENKNIGVYAYGSVVDG